MADSRNRRKIALLALAAVAGASRRGAGGIFHGHRQWQPGARPVDCAPAATIVKRVAPLARGEVAAFRVADPPEKLENLGFKGPDGAHLTLAAFTGKTVLVNLWATWCVPCRAEMPALDRLQAAKGGDRFQVVAVNVDLKNTDRARAFLDETGVKDLAFYSDPTNSSLAKIKQSGLAFGLPTTLLFDGKGCRLGVLTGPAVWDSADASALIEAAIQ